MQEQNRQKDTPMHTHTDNAYIKKPDGGPVLCSKPLQDSSGGAREEEEDRIKRRRRRK